MWLPLIRAATQGRPYNIQNPRALAVQRFALSCSWFNTPTRRAFINITPQVDA
jgi:hypothetical protein